MGKVKPGLKERHYQCDLTAEMREVGLKVSEEHHVEVYDGDRWLGRLYLDHLVEDCVVVEVKAFSHVLTYLGVIIALHCRSGCTRREADLLPPLPARERGIVPKLPLLLRERVGERVKSPLNSPE